MRFYFLILILLLLGLGQGFLLAEGTNELDTVPYPDDDFAPGLFIFAIVMVVGLLLLLGIGLVVGAVLCALAGTMVALGIVSSSVAFGFFRRSPGAGFRALILQLGAAAGIATGIGAAWLVSWMMESGWSAAERSLTGAAIGLFWGLLVAWLVNLAWSKAVSFLFTRLDPRRGMGTESNSLR